MLIPERNQANAEREIYLVEVTRCLSARLSPIEVYESVTELRDHIDAMAAAHEELGLDSETAMRLSLGKFGDPRSLGESLGQASGKTWSGRIRPDVPIFLPATVALTMLTTWVSAFVLLNLCDFLFLVSFHGMPMGVQRSGTISFVVADIVTLLAVFVPHKRSFAFAGWLTGAFNVFMGLTLYQTYLNLGRSQEFVLIAATLTVSVYAIGFVASRAQSYFKGRFPSNGVPAL
jgi:hypothetical protein